VQAIGPPGGRGLTLTAAAFPRHPAVRAAAAAARGDGPARAGAALCRQRLAAAAAGLRRLPCQPRPGRRCAGSRPPPDRESGTRRAACAAMRLRGPALPALALPTLRFALGVHLQRLRAAHRPLALVAQPLRAVPRGHPRLALLPATATATATATASATASAALAPALALTLAVADQVAHLRVFRVEREVNQQRLLARPAAAALGGAAAPPPADTRRRQATAAPPAAGG
jgi:hypothetical protein